MLKKRVLLTVLLVLALSCAFAGNSRIDVKASPYSFQYVKGDKNYSSTYGFGFEAGYRYNIVKGLTVGGDVKYSNYKYSELSDRYNVLSFLANAGWTQQLGDLWTLTAEFGLGVQRRSVGSRSIAAFGMNLYTGAGFAVSKNVSVTCGADFGLAFQKNFKDLSVDVMLGTAIKL